MQHMYQVTAIHMECIQNKQSELTSEVQEHFMEMHDANLPIRVVRTPLRPVHMDNNVPAVLIS